MENYKGEKMMKKIDEVTKNYYNEIEKKHEQCIRLIDFEKGLLESEIELTEKTNNIQLNTDWTTAIEDNPKPTRDMMEAYTYNETKDLQKNIKYLKLKISTCKLELQLTNDRIKYYRQFLRTANNFLNNGDELV